MLGLQDMLSGTPFIVEIDTTPSIDGTVLFLLGLAISLSLVYLVLGREIFGRGNYLVLIGAAIVIFTLGAISFTPGYINIGVILLSFYYLVKILLAKSAPKEKRGPFVQASALVIALLGVCASFSVYFLSIAYFLPASYSEPVRGQLRMLSQVYLAQMKGHKTSWLPSSSSPWRDTDVVPGSIEREGSYRSYRYRMDPFPAHPSLFQVKAIPMEGSTSPYSFLLLPVEFDAADRFPPDYCITISRTKGKEATASDQHFHRRGIHVLDRLIRGGPS